MKKKSEEHRKKLAVLECLSAARDNVREVMNAMEILGAYPGAVHKLKLAFQEINRADDGTWNRSEKSFKAAIRSQKRATKDKK